MIMIAQSDTQHLFRFILLDDKTIQILLHVARLVFKFEIIRLAFARFHITTGRFFRSTGVATRILSRVLKMLPDEIGQLPLEFPPATAECLRRQPS